MTHQQKELLRIVDRVRWLLEKLLPFMAYMPSDAQIRYSELLIDLSAMQKIVLELVTNEIPNSH